jgi:two-component system response regulator
MQRTTAAALTPRPLDILLVEDNAADRRLAQEALREAGVHCRLHWVRDGIEALEFLHRTGTYTEVPRPDLVLLDLNMPRMDGREVLAHVKSDPLLRHIPVVILTTSRAREDIRVAYDLHANCYITKSPLDFNAFVEVFRSLDRFWHATVTLPPKP